MTAIPPHGLILVTGANGHLASVTIKVFLERGFKVRGTVRSVEKHNALVSYYGSDFSLVEVPDFSRPGAFDEAMIGVDGVAHMAADASLQDRDEVVEEAVQGVLNIMNAAAKQSSVKRVVLTSARAAALNEMPGTECHIGLDSWNEEAVEQLRLPAGTLSAQDRGHAVYGAAKYKAEKCAFDFMQEHKPHFVFNSILPNVNIGRTVAVEHLGFPSGSSLINTLDKGYPLGPVALPNQLFVNTEDTALLHLAALTREEVQNERLLAMSAPFSWKRIVEILTRKFPERKSMVQQCEDGPAELATVDNSRAAELLKKMGRPGGFRTLEQSLVDAMECIIAADSLPSIPRTLLDEYVDMIFKGKPTA
ncbi:NAD dependent epimerase/dehydratase family protein [Sarocladium implicatum]|nr:NAD dependent epimerase/dehydratase family protein [Sarocladium implicatum]